MENKWYLHHTCLILITTVSRLDLDSNISSIDLAAALESQIEGMGALEIKKSFTCPGAEFEIKWIENGGNKPQFSINGDNLIGHEVNVTTETIQNGGIIYGPLSGEFMQLAKTTPQVYF